MSPRGRSPQGVEPASVAPAPSRVSRPTSSRRVCSLSTSIRTTSAIRVQRARSEVFPDRVVIEITERTAIKDYPKFRERPARVPRNWISDSRSTSGSGYAGLGSIANLEPDFIKLDISLINGIDTNFIKQNLVETMVKFSNDTARR
jgi:EAL domain-containing protein (putative c-di-GMP-specific phosphodiesterase class I)